jgi:hypothetical protein
MTAKTGQWRQESWGQECWRRTAGTGQPGNDRLERSVDHRTAREDSRDNTARAGNRGHEGQNMTARTGQPGQDNGAGIHPSQDKGQSD